MTDLTERYDYTIDPDGDSTANKVLRMVGENKRVLELGCGPGAMTRFMHERLTCEVTAVELDPAGAELARPFCQRLLIADLETLDFAKEFSGERFDAIIAADVLEHLRDPWACLHAVRDLLTPAGYLVVSIPNIAHNALIAQLIAGRFPYQDKGLLDRTHLRFFTRHDIADLLLACGFQPSLWETSVAAEEATEFGHVWDKTAPAVRRALADSADGQTYQFVVKAYASSDAGWQAKARAEHDAALAESHQLKRELNSTRVTLEEHQKAFAEAQEIIKDKETALTEYTTAFHEAREVLSERDRQLDESNLALAEARNEVTRLGAEIAAIPRPLLARVANRLRRIIHPAAIR